MTGIDRAPWPAWIGWAEGPVSVLCVTLIAHGEDAPPLSVPIPPTPPGQTLLMDNSGYWG